MEATRSEIDTFKIMSNSDFVDWSKGQQMIKSKEPNVIFETDSDDDSIDSEKFRELSEAIKKEEEDKHSVQSSKSSKSSKSSRSSQSIESHRSSHLVTAINTPLPPSSKSSPEPIPTPPLPSNIQIPFHSTVESSSPGESFPRRTLPVPKKYTAEEENEDYEILAEKEALLQDLLSYERPPNNMKLTRQWNVKEHTLDELQFEYDRIQSELNANQMVDMAKSGIKFGVGGIEMFLKQAGFNAVDGWYKNSCADMNKYNRPLIKLYKRYWRKTTMSPIMELAFLLFGGLAWTVAQNKMGLGGPSTTSPPIPTVPSMPIPRATEYEPTRQGPPPMMRPPSMAGVTKGPRWTTETSTSNENATPTPVAAPNPTISVTPIVPKEDTKQTEKLNSTLENLSQQNALMLQVLQNMNENIQKSNASRRSSISSRSSAKPSPVRTPQLRVPLKTPTSKRISTIRSRGNNSGSTLVL
jgi:hypothetical protein